jgi:hypothetical protein
MSMLIIHATGLFREVLEVFVPKMLTFISCLIANQSTFKVYSYTLKMSNWFLPGIAW